MSGINKVILIGNLGADPELRSLPSGGSVANLSLATSETWKDKTSGEPQERTEWHRVSIFGKLAEIAGQYLEKGSKVYIEGQLRTRKWQDQSGQDRYTTEVVVQGYGGTLQMLGRTGGTASSNRDSARAYRAKRDGTASVAALAASAKAQAPAPADFDDDIPF